MCLLHILLVDEPVQAFPQPGAGRIGAAGLTHLLRHPGLAGAIHILETPGMDEGYDAVNLDRAQRLAAGRPVADLPPAAFELAGSRARTAPP